MPNTPASFETSEKSRLDRLLSMFATARAGEGATAILMLVNVFVLRTVSQMRPGRLSGATAAAMILLVAMPAAAQETREEQKAAERAEKATRLQEYVPNVLEKRLGAVDKALSSKRPVYVAFGGPMSGGGLVFGPGYRARFGDTGSLDARLTWSVRNYKSAEGTLTLPRFGNDRMSVDVHGTWIDAPAVPFYESATGRTDFGLRTASASATATLRVSKQVTVGATLDGLRAEAPFRLKAEATNASTNALAGTMSPAYRRSAVSAQFDSRTSPGYTRSGSLFKVDWADFHQVNGDALGFRRLDVEAQQFVPLMRENWVLAFRALATTTSAGEGRSVPYFLMPELGGGTLLRGYSSWRFRDRSRMLLTGEYRWTAGPLVDMAIFVDAGKVAPRREDLNFRGLHYSQGIGIRLHTPSATLTRLELARSREGLSAILSFNPSF